MENENIYNTKKIKLSPKSLKIIEADGKQQLTCDIEPEFMLHNGGSFTIYDITFNGIGIETITDQFSIQKICHGTISFEAQAVDNKFFEVILNKLPPKKMTLKEVEARLGYQVEIISGD